MNPDSNSNNGALSETEDQTWENCDDIGVDEGVHGQISSYGSKVDSTPKECPGEMMQKSKSTVRELSPSKDNDNELMH